MPKVREKDGKREVQEDVISVIKSNGTAKCSASVQPVASRDSSVGHVQTCRSQIWPGRGRRRCWQRSRSDVYLQTEGAVPGLARRIRCNFTFPCSTAWPRSCSPKPEPGARSRSCSRKPAAHLGFPAAQQQPLGHKALLLPQVFPILLFTD